jgi:hypothetical protein
MRHPSEIGRLIGMGANRHLGTYRALWLLATGLLSGLVSACNAISGVNDLEVIEEPGQPLGVACDAIRDRGCRSGQTCRFDRKAGKGVCSVLTGAPLDPYAACSQDSECPGASLCVEGVCRELCLTSADCAAANARCIAADGAAFSSCSRNCDLTSPGDPRIGLQACGAGTRCDFVSEEQGDGYTDCFAAAGSSFEGGACQANADCPGGLNCAAGRCERMCDATNHPCPDGLSCALASYAGQLVGRCCSIPTGQVCDLVSDCGCSRGETCAVIGSNVRSCRSVPRVPVEPYAACTTHDECPSRHSCIGGACHLHCNARADCGSEGDQCAPVLDANNDPIPGQLVCTRHCDPLSAAAPRAGFQSCGAELSCMLFDGAAGTPPIFSCGSAGIGVQGSSCVARGDCAPGFDCFNGECERWCVPNEVGCTTGFICGAIGQTDGLELGSCCSVPAGKACDWLSECGCRTGESCSLNASNVRQCRVVSTPPPSAPYQVCSVDSDCPALHSCYIGSCMQHCKVSADCGWENAVCYIVIDVAGGPVPETGLCTRNCDVLSPSAPEAGFQPCGVGLTCADFVSPEGAFFDCNAAGAGTDGSICTSVADCAIGFSCPTGVCARYCEVGVAGGCPAGGECIAEPTIPSIGGRALGLCPTAAPGGG